MIVAPAAGSERVTLPDITRAGVPLVLIDRGLAVDPALVLDGDSNTDVAEHAVRSLMSGVSRPTALESLNNAMAIDTLKAVRGLRLSIPTDVAFVCYDDFEWSDLFEPRPTAVA